MLHEVERMNKQNESIFSLIRRGEGETTVKEDKKKRKPESFIIGLMKEEEKTTREVSISHH